MSSDFLEQPSPVIGLGACLVGNAVRYNAEAKRKNRHIEALRDHCELRSFCPEVAIGLGVPREPVRLVGKIGDLRLKNCNTQEQDYTESILEYAAFIAGSNEDLSGYIGVKGSPSCGFERVKRFDDRGRQVASDAQGIFLTELQRLRPLLPVEEDGRLHDMHLRENFITRVFAYADWQRETANGVSHRQLVEFWSRYKYLVMAHHVESYQRIGRLVAGGHEEPVEVIADRFAALLMNALKNRPTRRSHANVLEHIRGYLKNTLSREDKAELTDLIAQYRDGLVPLVVPMTMISHHFKKNYNPYIAQQRFLQPHPRNLGLRNMV